jgi:hypothetical protein
VSLDFKSGPSYYKDKGMLPTPICGQYGLSIKVKLEYETQANDTVTT